jgi:hypothetical protein
MRAQAPDASRLSLKDCFRLKFETWWIQASGFSWVFVWKKQQTAQEGSQLKALSRCREVDFLKNKTEANY